MALQCVNVTNSLWAQTQRPVLGSLFRCLSISYESFIPSSSSSPSSIDESCSDFIPWLNRKAGFEISSSLFIGKSSHGRGLFAAKNIQYGETLLKVPYCVQLAPDNLPQEITALLGNEVGSIAKVALLILLEKKLGERSEWAPYISRLPSFEDLHHTIFWNQKELGMIRSSGLYQETLKQKAQIKADFEAVKVACDRFPDYFRTIAPQEFAYAHGLVTSRAWESSRGVSLIPFADFLNHDGNSDSCVLSDESQRVSEVIADHDFAPSEEVLIRYGRFSNTRLLLDFGFTVSQPRNRYDEVLIKLDISEDDDLRKEKLKVVDRYRTRSSMDVNEFITTSTSSFTIKKVSANSKKGKGIPQSLRAFARVLTCKTLQELEDLASEAERRDGRLARVPLKDRSREVSAHQLLIDGISKLMEKHSESLELIEGTPPLNLCTRGGDVVRRRLAHDLLTGELRVMESAFVWLKRYCSTLREEDHIR